MNTHQIRILNALQARHADVRQKIEALTRTIAQGEDHCTWTHGSLTSGSVEDVLARLMVQDRARLERQPVPTVDDDLLDKLHVIAIASSRTQDLRFIDALNYYYELLSNITTPDFEHNWLFVSFLEEYALALGTLSKKIAAACA